MYGIVEGEWDWLDNIDTERVGEYVERAAPHIRDALTGQGGAAVTTPTQELESTSRFDWKWGALAVLSGALLFSMLRSK